MLNNVSYYYVQSVGKKRLKSSDFCLEIFNIKVYYYDESLRSSFRKGENIV